MGRYLERAGLICRMIQIQLSALIDRPLPEIHFGWSRIYGSLKTRPHGGMIEHPDDVFALADAFTLAGDLTLSRNFSSIKTCFEFGRENARQMRHLISDEMWSSLNQCFLEFQKVEMHDVWRAEPEKFYAALEREFETFFALASATMYRDRAWHFIRLGRLLDRNQLTASFMISHCQRSVEFPELRQTGVRTMLRTFRAEESYRRMHGYEPHQHNAIDMLVSDPNLSASLLTGISQIVRDLESIGHGIRGNRNDALDAARTIALRVDQFRQDKRFRDSRLLDIESASLDLHNLIGSQYFSPDENER